MTVMETSLLSGFQLFISSVPTHTSLHIHPCLCIYPYVNTNRLGNIDGGQQEGASVSHINTIPSLFRSHKSDSLQKVMCLQVSSDNIVPQSSEISLALQEGRVLEKKPKQNPQPKLSMLFNGIHPTGQEFPYRSGKKIPPPFLNITFHMVNPSESLLWNE